MNFIFLTELRKSYYFNMYTFQCCSYLMRYTWTKLPSITMFSGFATRKMWRHSDIYLCMQTGEQRGNFGLCLLTIVRNFYILITMLEKMRLAKSIQNFWKWTPYLSVLYLEIGMNAATLQQMKHLGMRDFTNQCHS